MKKVTILEAELLQLLDIIEEQEMKLEEREESPQIDRIREILDRHSAGENESIQEGSEEDDLSSNISFVGEKPNG